MARKRTAEEYIEVVYRLGPEGERVRTGEIAREMDIRPASVTQMLSKLDEDGLLDHEPYKGARLTRRGKRMARDLEMRHSTVAEFLRFIGVEEGLAQKDACRIEHHVDPETVRRLHVFIEFVEKAKGDQRWLREFERRYHILDGKGGD